MNLWSPELLEPEDHDMTLHTPCTPQDLMFQWIQQQWLHQTTNQDVTDSSLRLANCKFEHPNNNRQNQNPFSVLQNQRGPAGRPAGGNNDNPYHLLPDTIVKDLTEERPSWSLSAYGPGREAPEQLWGGPIEQSYEEMRLHFELAAAQGNPQAAVGPRIWN